MSAAADAYLEMDAATKEELVILVRGVAHSASARREFNAFCLAWGVRPNDLLAYVHGHHDQQDL